MSPANGRPLPPTAPSQRSDSADGSESRATGVRARSEGETATGDTKTLQPATKALPISPPVVSPQAVSVAPIISEAASAAVPLAEGIRNNSIAPEALRKPYASLAPQPKKTPSQTSANRSPTGPRPQLESFPGIEDELTGAGQTNSGQPSSGQTNPGAPSSGKTNSVRSVCKKHKIARGKNGECMLCRKEEPVSSGGLGWKLMVAFIVLAVVVSAVIAAYVKLQHL